MESNEEQTGIPLMAYRQTDNERMLLRKEYRKLIKEVQDNKEELIKPECGQLLDHVNVANTLFKRVTTTREGVLDSKFMALSVTLAGQKTNLLQTDLVAFEPDEFMEKLVTKMEGRFITEDEDKVDISSDSWKSMGEYVSKFYTSVNPVLTVMSGTFDFVPKPIRPTAVKATEMAADGRADPQHLTRFDGDKKEATPEEIENVLRVIRDLYKNQPYPIDYFELVVDPESFGRTIENAFHLAFLVKDGFVRIFLDDENSIPVVEPIERPEDRQSQMNKKCSQVMVSLSMEEWRDIIDAYELEGTTPYIKRSTQKSKQSGNSSSKRAKT